MESWCVRAPVVVDGSQTAVLAMLDALSSFCTELYSTHPLFATAATLVALWFAAITLRSWQVGVPVTQGAGGAAREDAMKAAREKQQALFAAAASRRTAPPAAATPAPDRGEAEMPTRMRATLERLEQAPEQSVPPGQGAPQPPPAAGSKPARPSYSERLAKIEKGKGPSDANPLLGHASKSCCSAVNRKKGG